jgi:hypothetical protein
MGTKYSGEKAVLFGNSGPSGNVTAQLIRDNFGGGMHSEKAPGGGTQPYQDPALWTTPAVQHKEILEHLEHILSHSLFRNSKRYAAVLRYIVERTLQGNEAHLEAHLKERTIGIEVFHRAPDYDTANDHVVRSAMSEVRRRLAQYYREDGSESKVRIELQPGSYVPHFSHVVAGGPAHDTASTGTAGTALTIRSEKSPLLTRRSHIRAWRRTALVGAVAFVAVAVLLLRAYSNDPLQTFWGPVFSAEGPVLLCVGTLGKGRQSAGGAANAKPPITLSDFHSADAQLVHINDAITLAELARLLGQHKKACRLASQSETNFTDLQNGPAVLVGLMNNDWTERLISNLRFTVRQDPQRRFMMIYDRDNPARRDWTIDYTEPYQDITKDYALILRMKDPKTDQVVVVAAGLSVFGTTAAGKFLSDPDDMKKLAAIAPPDWGNKNMEIVLSTVVIRGTAGHGTIVASQFW